MTGGRARPKSGRPKKRPGPPRHGGESRFAKIKPPGRGTARGRGAGGPLALRIQVAAKRGSRRICMLALRYASTRLCRRLDPHAVDARARLCVRLQASRLRPQGSLGQTRWKSPVSPGTPDRPGPFAGRLARSTRSDNGNLHKFHADRGRYWENTRGCLGGPGLHSASARPMAGRPRAAPVTNILSRMHRFGSFPGSGSPSMKSTPPVG